MELSKIPDSSPSPAAESGLVRAPLSILALALALALLPAPARPALAQAPGDPAAPPTLPGAALERADPGRIQRRIDERDGTAPRPGPEPTLSLPEGPAPFGPSELPAEAPTMRLTSVELDGAAAIAPETLAPAWAKHLGHEIGLPEIEAILAAITARYREAGYFLSRAVAPPQDPADGVLRVRVIEGRLDKVTFHGARPGRWNLQGHAERLKAEAPLTLATLERQLLLIGDLPGLDADAGLRPVDDDAGLYELVVELSEQRFDASTYLDNRGTPAVGRLQGYGSLGSNAAFGLAERLQLGIFTVPDSPQELLYGELVYHQPIGSDGLSMTTRLSASRVDAGAELAPLDTESHSRNLEVQLGYPVVRSRAFNLSVAAIASVSDIEQDILGSTVLDDQLRVVRLRGDLGFTDGLDGANGLTVTVSQGLDLLGASPEGRLERSRINGEVDFTKLTVEASRQQNLPWNFGLLVAVTGQAAFDPLLSSEEFALGGSRFGRAYDFSEITGEHGIGSSVELRYGQDLPMDWLPGVQLYAFYDWGAVWNDLPGGGKVRDSLSSAGGGLRFGLFDTFQAGVEVGVPLTRRVGSTGDYDPRVFFTLTGSF